MTDTKVKWNNLHWSGQLQDLWHCRPAFYFQKGPWIKYC